MNRRLSATELLAGVFVVLVAVYFLIFALNSLTRWRYYSPDSMNYVDVARNIVRGRGIGQSTLGYNDTTIPLNGPIPEPLTIHGPGYPLMIALVSRTGISYNDAALVIPIVGYMLTVLAGYLLARAMFNAVAGLVAVIFLLLYYPLSLVAGTAWSEAPSLALALLSLCLIIYTRRTNRRRYLLLVSAGLLGGGAFATRYPFLPLIALGLLPLIEYRAWIRTAQNAAAYVIGFLIPAGMVIVHNWTASGTLLGQYVHSNKRFILELKLSLSSILTFGSWDSINPDIKVAALAAAIVVVSVVMAIRHTSWRVLVNRYRYLLLLWGVAFPIFISYQHTMINFTIEARTMGFIGVVWIIGVAGLIVGVRSISMILVQAVAIAAVLLLGLAQLETYAAARPTDDMAAVQTSGALTWIQQHTTTHDLLFGAYTLESSFYFDRSFDVWPGGLPFFRLTHNDVLTLANRFCNQYDHLYLLIDPPESEPQIADASTPPFQNDNNVYSDITFKQRLSDALIFTIQCPAATESAKNPLQTKPAV